MTPKNTEKLYKKYPKIFKQKNDSMQKTCMCFGFACGDGWYWLIDNLCSCIQNYIDSNDRPQVEAVQVKEKLGMLSFYIINGTPTTLGMIWLAGHLSKDICEICGATENVFQHTKRGWIKTLCKECISKR